MFQPSDEAWWYCGRSSGLFSIVQDGELVLGEGGERLAFFPTPSNARDPWHGFPVSSSDKQPSPAVIDRWMNDQIMSEHVRRKLEGGRL